MTSVGRLPDKERRKRRREDRIKRDRPYKGRQKVVNEDQEDDG